MYTVPTYSNLLFFAGLLAHGQFPHRVRLYMSNDRYHSYYELIQ